MKSGHMPSFTWPTTHQSFHARQPLRPASSALLSRFFPMNTILLLCASPSFHGFPGEPSNVEWTPCTAVSVAPLPQLRTACLLQLEVNFDGQLESPVQSCERYCRPMTLILCVGKVVGDAVILSDCNIGKARPQPNMGWLAWKMKRSGQP